RRVRQYGDRYHRGIRAEFARHHCSSSGAHAIGHRAPIRPVGRQHLSGRTLAGAIVLSAPGAGMGAVQHADSQPLYVRFGHASWGWHHGGFRTECRQENPSRMEKLMPSEPKRVVIIGAGHNGLAAAFYLGKAGYSPLVLERRDVIGGTAVTEEIHPGFRCPTVIHALGPLLPPLASEMRLDKQGLEVIKPDMRTLILHPDGKHLRI